MNSNVKLALADEIDTIKNCMKTYKNQEDILADDLSSFTSYLDSYNTDNTFSLKTKLFMINNNILKSNGIHSNNIIDLCDEIDSIRKTERLNMENINNFDIPEDLK